MRARQLHFLWFTSELNCLELVLPPISSSRETITYLLAIYAVHLGTGHSLSSQCLKSATITSYLLDVSQLLQTFDPAGRDFRKPTNDPKSIALPIAKVLAEFKRDERVPDRREPYTPQIHDHLVRAASTAEPNSLLSALCDWFAVALAGGFRLTEWAQPSHVKDLFSVILDQFGDTRAFTLVDVTFFDSRKRRLTHTQALTSPNLVTHVEVRWRTQKNGQNGEIKLFTINLRTPSLDPVANWLSIIRRFITLCGPDSRPPLAIFVTPTGHILPITSSHIEATMRRFAMETYGFSLPRDAAIINRFSAHSLRVGACVILHAYGFSAHDIQHLLRWRSTSFLDYLRNLVILTERHNQAISDLSVMPSL